MITVKKMIHNYLVLKGYQGLVSQKHNCWCNLLNKNFCNCEHNFKECIPGHYNDKKNEIITKKEKSI